MCSRIFRYTPGFFMFMNCHGEPPVHGLADRIMLLSFFLGMHISLLPVRAAFAYSRPPADAASSFSVMRILSHFALSGDSCPMTEFCPQHHSMQRLGFGIENALGRGSELSFCLELASRFPPRCAAREVAGVALCVFAMKSKYPGLKCAISLHTGPHLILSLKAFVKISAHCSVLSQWEVSIESPLYCS